MMRYKLVELNKVSGNKASIYSVYLEKEGKTLFDLFLEENKIFSLSELKKVEKRMLLAQKISDGIKANGWRKIDFARALNKRPSEISKWISGTHNFNSDNTIRY